MGNKCPAHDDLMFIVKDIKFAISESRKENRAEFAQIRNSNEQNIKDISFLKARASIFGAVGGAITGAVGIVYLYFKSKFDNIT